ncbi:Non-specific serine/threonine protein kinase protein [Dioscorea alata]|uniref:Non-specific serine/threonine protein kinase protein n=1 Tax=Dioscorea alata TaxID=55571 RepID=A0ACB7WNL0_DIOAL|nr:Non-specific serine/threonine protein kinase protein [Dioscorea alata]
MATKQPQAVYFSLVFLFYHLLLRRCDGQQAYLNNDQLDCNKNGSNTLGYQCNGAAKSCDSYLIFRSQPPYQSPVQIASLFSSNASAISAINDIPENSSALDGSQLIVPIPCSCSSSYYQHNVSYTLKPQDVYFSVANNTYQGLSTCQALIAQNPSLPATSLNPGDIITVPVRCACPTRSQINQGVRFLLTYTPVFSEDVPTLASRFNVTADSIVNANTLPAGDTIFPYTSLLIPLSAPPSKAQTITPPPPPPTPPPPPPPPTPASGGGGDGGSDNKGLYIGVSIGAAAILILCGVVIWFVCRGRRRRSEPSSFQASKEGSAGHGVLSTKSSTAPGLGGIGASDEIRIAIESLTVYKFRELNEATGSFGEEHKIKGSVYRGVINGDEAAIKQLKGDVSNEITILKQINHSNVIRLSGFCVHEGNTFLVYEFARNGSLADWLHHSNKDKDDNSKYPPSDPCSCLSWKQRVQIACGVADGLSYLHNYANPQYVHKDLRSSNILLDSEFTAKIANFGLARPVEMREALQLTRHVTGTQGYMAPEYLEHGLISPKLDVFSFGVVLLEILSGKEAVSLREKEGGEEKEQVLLSTRIGPMLSAENVQSELRDFIDPCLADEYPFDLAYAMAQLAMRCVARDPSSRPDMTEVLVTLSAIHHSTLDWDPLEAPLSGSVL